ncbi:hypothetical protein GAO09_05025 [Rhizobiales bacterium RZME27]|jgi:hypothetical protein|uniref:Uncharacterized protein n=1 Tax=Endobacterium cereale TaxID=2663029 RepID=A0A6A8A4A9_9HYPH|nr:hypothetical protein [Endobacterium cereale]MEB2846801.1 hypothetical protein [Endobacterium cereale]MQY45424.1 hypothetical protein [Endobacterium cereale]
MVKPVARISASAASEATRIDHSLSITSEPDNAWVAARQDRMTADQEERKRDVTEGDSEDHAREEADEALLSGESERIGSQNFDDDTPFGDRVAII